MTDAIALDLKTAAARCGLSAATLRRAISAGELRHARIRNRVVVTPRDLERWIGKHLGYGVPPELARIKAAAAGRRRKIGKKVLVDTAASKAAASGYVTTGEQRHDLIAAPTDPATPGRPNPPHGSPRR